MPVTDRQPGELQEWYYAKLLEFKDDPDYVLEGILWNTNEQLCARMAELGISRADLAQRLGVSRQYVTKLLNGKPNLTLKSLVDIALALDMDITIEIGGSQASRDAVLDPTKRAAKARPSGRKKERAAA